MEDYIPLTDDKMVCKKIITKGDDSPLPTPENQVAITYQVFCNGKLVQDRWDVPFAYYFKIGTSQYMKAFDIGVATMHDGEVAEFIVKGEYSFKEGEPAPVAPKTDVTVKIELLEILKETKLIVNLSDAEKIQYAKDNKLKGNSYFAISQFRKSLHYYDKASDAFLSLPKVLDADTALLKFQIQLNTALLQKKLGKFQQAINICNNLLNDSKNANVPKLRYIRGSCLLEQGLILESIDELKIANKIAPDDSGITQELSRANALLKEKDVKDKELAKKMFGGMYEEIVPKISTPLPKLPAYNPNNPHVYMDIRIGPKDPLRVVFELFYDKVPRTCENFKSLCTGEKSTPYVSLNYKGSRFFKVIRKFMMQGGDIERDNGTGGTSIYGKHFNDESFVIPHSRSGILSMAKIAGKENTNSSQFFITFNKCRWCDSKNVAFGRVVVGLNYIKSIQQLEVDKNDYDPLQRVVVEGCGIFKDKIPQEAIDLVMNPPKKKKEQPKKIE